MSLVETDWLEKNLHNVKIIDCSWHMPQTKRNGLEEYKSKHIPNAIFFDLDDNSKKDIDLPHMLVDLNEWEKIVSKMGIKKNDKIIVYDNSDVISSCRCWFNFIYYGHDPDLIHVLNGGLRHPVCCSTRPDSRAAKKRFPSPNVRPEPAGTSHENEQRVPRGKHQQHNRPPHHRRWYGGGSTDSATRALWLSRVHFVGG